VTLRLAQTVVSIRISVLGAILLATVFTSALAIGLQYHFGEELAKRAARDLYASVADGVAEKLRHSRLRIFNLIDLLVYNPLLIGDAPGREITRLFTRAMEQNPIVHAMYLGHADGRFFEVINLDATDGARERLLAEPSDRWMIISVSTEPAGTIQHAEYLDAGLNVRASRAEPSGFVVDSRPWYRDAMASRGTVHTAPYVFHQLKTTGQTYSHRLPDTDTVLGVDVTLATISSHLSALELSRHGETFVFDGSGNIIASSSPNLKSADELGHIDAVDARALLDIARSASSHAKMLPVQYRGFTHYAYVAPLSMADEAYRGFFGLLMPASQVMDRFMDPVRLSLLATSGLVILLLPLSWALGTAIVRPVQRLAGENDKVRLRQYDRVERVSTHIRELDELSESMVQMVEAIKAHEKAERELMDAIIQLIAQAIDDKSLHTAAHCERVPELAIMLAEAATNSSLPAFRDFALRGDDEWREYRIAAWLHDCGKIVTPEHIVEKGTKLETIYNRVHEIRTRFEVLWRDAEINYLRTLHAEPHREAALREELHQRQAALQADFRFVAACNVGGEHLDDESLARLHAIAERTWQRHFSDRIGLSPVEERRRPDTVEKLPVTERLLADKPEHLVARQRGAEHPPSFGIRMEVPEYEANLGELYNLSVSRGTLNTEDRFRINEHIISTIKMLEGLPFPPELSRVPRYATTHHETMHGRGYPRRIQGGELSIPERLLAIADIFEALTASDRPYKKAKPVSEAIEILHRMVLDGHIDRDCFELFIREGVYRRYATRFLPPAQIDEIDEARYLGNVHAR